MSSRSKDANDSFITLVSVVLDPNVRTAPNFYTVCQNISNGLKCKKTFMNVFIVVIISIGINITMFSYYDLT